MENNIAASAQKPFLTEKKEKSAESVNLKMFTYGLLGLAAVALVVVAGVGIYRVYVKNSTDKFTYTIAKVLRLPVAKFNGVTITYADYVKDLQAIHTLRNFDIKSNGPSATLTEEQMSDQVLWRLLNNVIISDMAKNFSVSVEQKDIEEVKVQIMKQFKNEDEASAALKDRYGWTMSQYEDKVIKYYILQNKLVDKISADIKSREEIMSKAVAILKSIKDGASFEETAKLQSQDGTAENGGDLGWFERGEMVPQFEEAAFALKKGELGQEVIETPFGYHIIKTTDKKTEEGVEQVRASHVFFRFPSMETYLDTATKNAKIHLYIKVHNPFEFQTAE